MNSMKARLAIYKGAKLDLAFPVTETVTTIGRDADNPVQLPDPQVSKRHAAIHAHGDTWTIEDLNSTNGIKVNGTRVPRATLKNNDRIRIGPFDLVFEAAAGDWVPTYEIDLSSKAAQQTIFQTRDQAPGGSDGSHRG